MAADGRQKSLDFLARSFSDAVGRGDAGPSGPLEEAWAEVVAGGLARRLEAPKWVEAAAWRWASSGHDVGRPYRQKIRRLGCGTLKRPESEQLLQKALRFEVSASELVARPEEDFLDDAQRELREKHRAEGLASVPWRALAGRRDRAQQNRTARPLRPLRCGRAAVCPGARVSIPPVAEFRQAQHIIFDTADVSSNESEDDDVLEDQTVPSVGSLDHGGAAGCRPCAFFMSSTGCRNGVDCNFCHLDHSPSERQLPKPSSRPAKGKRDKDKRRIAEINLKYANDEPRRLAELRRFAESQAYAARLLGFEGGKGKGGRGSQARGRGDPREAGYIPEPDVSRVVGKAASSAYRRG
ncbi:unnamed protein product [Durusdinium trenchii]|uniref:C3H1-type domain-containing protein n=1 Tax=Durusdinium trenchii TaxID=1381693 RepID=A0ABP0MQ18_9DINO